MELLLPISNDNILRVVSIDIGIKNFAIYTEDIDLEALNAIIKRPQGKRKFLIPDEDQLTSVYLAGSSDPKYANVYDLSEDNGIGTELTPQIRKNLFSVLESLNELWKSCSVVIIEKQFINTRGWGGKKGTGTANMVMIRLAESCFAWFIDHHYPSLSPKYYPSQNKTVICGCPKTFMIKSRKTGEMVERKATKPDRKKWSVSEGKRILTLRKDEELLTRLEEKKKRGKQKLDDICDCILQAQAYKWEMLEINHG